MGNELRVDSINTAQKRELAQKSYDTVRGVQEEPSVWETQFSPLALGSSVAVPLIFNRKEFKPVVMDAALKGKDLFVNTNNMRQLNELGHLSNSLKLKQTLVNGTRAVDPFMQADLISLQTQINNARNSGALSKDLLRTLNKEYASLLDKNLSWKTSFIEKGLTKAAKLNPGIGADVLRTYKSFKLPMFLMEAIQEIGPVMNAFTLPKEEENKNIYSIAQAKESSSINWESGIKQLGKSAGRIAAGSTGFIAAATLGTKIGGAIGSALGTLIPIPGAGTMLGGVLGSALGFAIGSVGSHLMRTVYNKIIPSETDIAKEKNLAKILDENDKSDSTKTALETEIGYHQAYLQNIDATIQQAEAEQDNDTYKQATANKASVEANYKTLVEVYQKKFGPITQASASATTSNESTTSVATTSTGVTASEASNTAAIANAAITNPQTAWNNPTMYNQAMMNNMPTTDWSAMLPLNTQKQYFGAIA